MFFGYRQTTRRRTKIAAIAGAALFTSFFALPFALSGTLLETVVIPAFILALIVLFNGAAFGIAATMALIWPIARRLLGSGPQTAILLAFLIGAAIAYAATDPVLMSIPDDQQARLLQIFIAGSASALVGLLVWCIAFIGMPQNRKSDP